MRNPFVRAALLACAGAVTAACSMLPDPGYAPPDASQAKDAYIAANLADADLLEAMGQSDRSELPAEILRAGEDWMNSWNDFQRANDIITLRKTSAFDRIEVSNCEWSWIEPELVRKSSQPRIAGEAKPAYLCDAEVFVTQIHGIKAKAMTKGYFYIEDGEWIYAGKSANGYRRYDVVRPARSEGTFSHSSRDGGAESRSNWGN